jgi:hypothetical protein
VFGDFDRPLNRLGTTGPLLSDYRLGPQVTLGIDESIVLKLVDCQTQSRRRENIM